MSKTFLVMRQELSTTFRRFSYVLFAFGVPVLVVFVVGAIKLIQAKKTPQTTSNTSSPSQVYIEPEGFVDHANLIHTISNDMQGRLIPFDNEALAQAALQDEKITAYYLIPEDYLTQGEVQYIYPDGSSYLSDGQKWVIQYTLNLNLLDGDSERADQIWNPVWEMERGHPAPELGGRASVDENCTQPGSNCTSNDLVRLMPAIMVVFFFMVFMTSSTMLFNSIGAEKENRTIELLMTSITPQQLLAGKTLALGLAGLIQSTVWLAAIYITFNFGGSTLKLPEGFEFPIGIALWGLVFFLGGFGVYASLMAGAGAMVPKMKEAGIANFLAMIPLFFGYVFGVIAPFGGFADSGFLTFLSFFPLTSPVVMVMRLTDQTVPVWQIIIAASLLFITAYYTLQMAAAMFHTQNLLSGQAFSVKRYFKALVGRA